MIGSRSGFQKQFKNLLLKQMLHTMSFTNEFAGRTLPTLKNELNSKIKIISST